MKSVTTIPSSGDSTAREAKVASSVLLTVDFNLSERDRELRQNEQILSSGRPSLGSSSHSQRNLRSPTFFAQPSIPQRHVTLRVGDQLKTIEDLRQKVRLLEEKISERDRLIEALQREGTSMYQALQKVESFAQDAEARNEKTVSTSEVLEVLYSSFHAEHPQDEEKWLNDGLSIGYMEDSFSLKE